MLRLYDFFVKTDATLVEVNPLGVTDENECMLLLCFSTLLGGKPSMRLTSDIRTTEVAISSIISNSKYRSIQ
jgi:hypothetical protein